MKQKPESHEGRATQRGRGYTVGYIHSLTTRCRLQSLMASTCCPREMRRSEGRGAAGGAGAATEEEPRVSYRNTRAADLTTSLHTPTARLLPTIILFNATGSALFHSFPVLLLFSSPGPVLRPHVGAGHGIIPFQPIVIYLDLYWPSPCRL